MVPALAAASLAALAVVPAEALEAAKLVASDPGQDDQFGISIAVDGATAVVGANFDDVDTKLNAGSAYIFRHNGSEWNQEKKLIASDGEQFDQFGVSVAVSGDTAVVGAYLSDDAGLSSGSAYVFRYDGSDWLEEAKLTASDSAKGDQFGFSVALSGDTAVVGASLNDDTGQSSGSAYVFRYNGSGWSEEAKLVPADPAAGDQFGFSVAVSGDTVAVGAHLADAPLQSDSGSVYVFRYNGTFWIQDNKLTALDAAMGDQFGFSVGVSGSAAVVGAPLHDHGPGLDAGSAYVFRLTGSNWIQEAQLIPADLAEGNQFGQSVGVDGGTAMVGAADVFGIVGSGYFFGYDRVSWLEQQKLTTSDNAPGDHFGRSVAISGDVALVAAYLDDAAGPTGRNAGSAYVFAVPELPDSDLDGVPDSSDNCIATPNSAQVDADMDGLGNICDGDFDNDLLVDEPDFAIFRACFNRATGPGGPAEDPDCAESDMNSDGFINGSDYLLFGVEFDGPPGPSL